MRSPKFSHLHLVPQFPQRCTDRTSSSLADSVVDWEFERRLPTIVLTAVVAAGFSAYTSWLAATM